MKLGHLNWLDSISASQSWGSLVPGRALLGLSNQVANILQNQDRIHARLLGGPGFTGSQMDWLLSSRMSQCDESWWLQTTNRTESCHGSGTNQESKPLLMICQKANSWPCWLSCWCWHAAMLTTAGTETLLNRTSISPCNANPWNFLNFA